MRNTKEINSKKAVEGTLCKLFGFKKVNTEDDKYELRLKIKCIDFNVLVYVDDLNFIDVSIEAKGINKELYEIMYIKYSFVKLKQIINRYKSLK